MCLELKINYTVQYTIKEIPAKVNAHVKQNTIHKIRSLFRFSYCEKHALATWNNLQGNMFSIYTWQQSSRNIPNLLIALYTLIIVHHLALWSDRFAISGESTRARKIVE